MAEWLKAHAWKACLLERVTWVRIPLSPPASLDCRETAPPFAAKYAKMPRIRKISCAKRTGENELLRIDGVDLLAFLWTAHAQSGFRDFDGRMQRDHKPTMWRKRLDLAASLGMPFVASHKGVYRYLCGETSYKPTSWEFRRLLRITLHWPTYRD